MRKVWIGVLVALIVILAVSIETGAVKSEQVSKSLVIPKPVSVADYSEKFKKLPEPSAPLPDSELVNIVFSKTWLLENDKDDDPNVIKVTFPKSWIDEPPEITENNTVHLRIPKKC